MTRLALLRIGVPVLVSATQSSSFTCLSVLPQVSLIVVALRFDLAVKTQH